MIRHMNQDRWTAVVCLIIAVLFTLAIPSQTSDRPLPGARGFDILDGAFFPELAVMLFAIAAIWLFIEARPKHVATGAAVERASADGLSPDSESAEEQPPGMSFRDFLSALALSGGMLFYVQFLDPLGYLICTIIGVSILALICGLRSIIGLFFVGLVYPTIVFYLFSRLFLVPLPRGFF